MRCHAFGCDAPDTLDPEDFGHVLGLPAHPDCADDDADD